MIKVKSLIKVKITDGHGSPLFSGKIEPVKLDSVIDAIKKKLR